MQDMSLQAANPVAREAGPPLDQIQAHVLRSTNPRRSTFLFFQIRKLDQFRGFLSLLLGESAPPDVPAGFAALPADQRRIWSESERSVADDGGSNDARCAIKSIGWNVAFTSPGLEALNIDKNTCASFPVDFRDGMAARSERLGDTGDSSPETWDGCLGSRQVHGLLSVHSWQSGEVESPVEGTTPLHTVVAAVTESAQAFGFEILHLEEGESLVRTDANGTYRIEHFGFRDGISQPGIALGGSPPPPGAGTPRSDGSWAPVAPGELLLGHPDEDGIRQERPVHPLLRDNATYLVFRKLEQDVHGFRRYIARHEGAFDCNSRLAAQMMGRWPDGTPLQRSPHGSTTAEPDHRYINDFRYRDDPKGSRCPIAAHIRRANPRDTNDRDESRRHRIWRRGISYGGPFIPHDEVEDRRPRGVLFVALNARIDQQFEFVQSRWLNGGEFMGQVGAGKCPIVGANLGRVEDSFVVPGRPAPYPALPRFVMVRGGDYFFMPSIPALKAIARGEMFECPTEPEEKNPSVDATPEMIDAEALFRLGKNQLSGGHKCSIIEHQGLLLTACTDHIHQILESDEAFTTDYDERTRRITGNEPLIVSLPPGSLDRDARLTIWCDAVRHHEWQSHRSTEEMVRAITAAAMQAILARYGPTGKLELVNGCATSVILALAREYYGIVGPPWLSPGYLASIFNQFEMSEVPPDWIASLPPLSAEAVPYATLRAWLLLPFMHIFDNVVNADELGRFAERTTAEMFRHVDDVIAKTADRDSKPPTLLGSFLSLDPKNYAKYEVSEQRFLVLVRLLLVELLAASLRTVSQALASVINELLKSPERLQMARSPGAPMCGIVREALRFDPVAPVLFRRCTKATSIGGCEIPEGKLICLLLKAAMFDPRSFPRPDAFDPLRPKSSYLHFGRGEHACKGADLAIIILEEMVRRLIELDDLRIAAGPAAERLDPFGRRETLIVRFKPN